MDHFDYVRAAKVEDALALLNDPGIKSLPLAGSTDLILLLKKGQAPCKRVVDISQIPELHRIELQDGWVSIGAAATFSEVIESPLVQSTAPVLVQACRLVGAVQIRNMGTLGGNVANAAACADSLPALVCLDAVAAVRTPEGEKDWLVTELVRGPNRTHIPKGGLLTSLRYRVPDEGSRSAFLKLGRRNAMAISRMTVAALGRLDRAGQIAEARLVPGSATPQICHFTTVEESLLGKVPSPQVIDEAAALAAAEMVRMAGWRWSSEYKQPALTAMIARALALVFLDEQGAGR